MNFRKIQLIKGGYRNKAYLVIAFCSCFLVLPFLSGAQHLTSSPYSMYGIGELMPQSTSGNAGMGSAGLALGSREFLNVMNPASYNSIDSSNFILAIGAQSQYSKYKIKMQSEEANSFNISYLALGWRITPWLATGFGINPYSTAGYEINVTAPIENTNITYPLNINGSGNINRAYLSVSLAPLKNLSLGVKSSYLFGSLVQTQHHDFSRVFANALGMYYQKTDYFRNFLWEFGLQYKVNVAKNTFSLGAVYTPAQNLLHGNDWIVFDSAGNTHNTDNYDHWEDDFQIPEKYEVGLAWTNNKNLVCVLDAGMQKWSDYNYKEATIEMKDSPYIRGGVEFTPSRHFMAPYIKRISYRAGYSYGKSYLKVKSYQLEENVISLGAGLPLRNSLSRIDISFEGGQKGTVGSTVVMRETFLRFRVDFTLKDLWFQKRKFN